MKNPILIELNKEKPSVKTVKQLAYIINENEKQHCLNYILSHEKPELTLIFCSTKYKSDRLYRQMSRFYNIGVIHGDLSQNQRERVLSDFKNRRIIYLIATDVAARGIDVKNISHVINYDMPNDIETYIHRIGRTGRAGALGKSITFTTSEEIPDLLRIENFVKVKIEKKKYVNGEFLAVSPDEISVKNVIIPRWSRQERFRGGFNRGFSRRPMNRGFRNRRFRSRRYR